MPDHLLRAAQARHRTTTAKPEQALLELSREHLPISFVAVARRAGVSTDFLYRHPVLRARIGDLRLAPGTASTVVAPEVSNTASATVRALSARLEDLQARHREQVADLERSLAAAQGENLQLRRRLALHEDL